MDELHLQRLERVFRVAATNGAEKIYDLSRFLEAHEKDYHRALKEVKAGYKRTHWMWYIFPQNAGLGFSRISQFYSISDFGEAKAYLRDAVLGTHMRELCEALLALETNDAAEVFDWPDDMKLKSCMTLFELADPGQKMYGDVLDKFFVGEIVVDGIEFKVLFLAPFNCFR